MTDASIDPTMPTVAELLARGHAQLLGEFLAVEAAAFQAESTMPTPRGEAAAFLAELEQARVVLTEELEQLMVYRLSASTRSHVLLERADTAHIVSILFEDTKMDQDARQGMAAARKVIDVLIAERINFLAAIDSDPYTAFAKFVLAVSTEIASNGGTYAHLVQDPRARNAVYRACMTPASWQRWTIAAVSLIKEASLATITEGGAPYGMDEEVAAIIEAVILGADDAATATLDATARRLRAYYGRRQREIWPTHPRG